MRGSTGISRGSLDGRTATPKDVVKMKRIIFVHVVRVSHYTLYTILKILKVSRKYSVLMPKVVASHMRVLAPY